MFSRRFGRDSKAVLFGEVGMDVAIVGGVGVKHF